MKKIFSLLIPLFLLSISGCKSEEPHVDTGREGFINLYAINDYHGRISYNKTQNINGISRLSAFLNEQKYNHELEYVFLNSGDLWQDTYESNSNQGACMTEIMEEMNCEAMELGNHEFDWTLDTIRQNKEKTSKCSYLGANIYYFDKNTNQPTVQASDLCSPYKVVERNGYKIGVIGVIGTSQITSITSTLWENLTFVEPLEIVKEYSNELRTNQGCDLIVLLSHSDSTGLSSNFCNQITSINPETGKPYINCCFTGHSHNLEDTYFNNIPFIQGNYGGSHVSHIEFDLRGTEPTLVKAECLRVNTDKTDSKIDKIVNKYITKEFIAKRDEVVCTVSDINSISSSYAGRLQAYATYEEVKKIEIARSIEIVGVFNNGGRSTVKIPSNKQLTRELVFNLTPFTNKTYIAKVTGANLSNAIRSYKYFAPKPVKLEQDKEYYIACIDYLYFHKTESRKYDYFSSGNGEYIDVIDSFPDTLVYNYLKNKNLDSSFFTNQGFSNLS